MNAEQKRLADALHQLDITHERLSGLQQALEYMLENCPSFVADAHPIGHMIFALRASVTDVTQQAEDDTQAVWAAAKPILGWEVRHA